MENLFYFGVFVSLIYSIFLLVNSLESDSFYHWVKNLAKYPDRELDSGETFLVIFIFIIFLLTITGLLSSQWFIFLFLILFGAISLPFIKRFKSIRLIVSVINILGLMFILINKYQLHIQFNNIFIKWMEN